MYNNRVALIMPNPPDDNQLIIFKRIVQLLLFGAHSAGQSLRLYLIVHKDIFAQRAQLLNLDNTHICILCYKEAILPRGQVKTILKAKPKRSNKPDTLNAYRYLAPYDDSIDLSNMDGWLWFSDKIKHAIAPLTNIGFIAIDFVQRYTPDVLSPHDWKLWLTVGLPNLRAADYVYFTSASICTDAVHYAGLAEDKIVLLPLETLALADTLTTDSIDNVVSPPSGNNLPELLDKHTAIQLWKIFSSTLLSTP